MQAIAFETVMIDALVFHSSRKHVLSEGQGMGDYRHQAQVGTGDGALGRDFADGCLATW